MPNYRTDEIDQGFLDRQLNHVQTKTYDRRYPELIGRSLVHVSQDIPAGAKTYSWIEYDSAGIAELITSEGTDMRMADVSGKEHVGQIGYYGLGYQFNRLEVLGAQVSGVPLDVRKGTAARQGHEIKIDLAIFFGDKAAGTVGLLNQPNAQSQTLPNSAAAPTNTKWTSKTADEIIKDVGLVMSKISGESLGIYRANRVLLPIEQYTLIATMPRSTLSDTTVLKFLETVYPGVTFTGTPRCKGAGLASADRMAVYNDSIDVCDFILPLEFEQLPGQWEGITYKVPCLSGHGGVRAIHPLSFCYADGL